MTSFAARSAELVGMDWKQLKRCTKNGPNGQSFYKLTYDRSKQRAAIKSRADNCSFIRGDLEVAAIEKYFSCFTSDDDRNGVLSLNLCHSCYFFTHHIIYRKSFSQLVAEQVIKKVCATVGSQIAKLIGIPNC